MASLTDSLKPVGTYEEVIAMNGDPRRVFSCSPPTKGNQGCTWYDKCPARAFRDKKDGKKGPAVGVVFVQISDEEGAHAANLEMPCFDYHYSGLYERRKQADETGEIIIIRGWEGDGKEYDFRETKRKHEKKDPTCQACMKNECHSIEEVTVRRKIEPFKRPAEAYGSVARGVAIREEMERENEQAATSAMLDRKKRAEQVAT